jgi:hypothetical protein
MEVVWRIAYQVAQLLEAHGGTGRRSLWRICRQAHGRLPCSIRQCIGLSLGLHIVSAPDTSPTYP